MADAPKSLPPIAKTLIATVSNDITIPYYTDILQPLDDTLIARGGGGGLKIYDTVARDAHAYAVLQKRKMGLVARAWVVEPASSDAKDVKAAQMVEERLKRLNFDQICLDLLDATLKGFAVTEIIWENQPDGVGIKATKTHDQRRFAFDFDFRLRLLTRTDPVKGIELPERKFVVHRFGVVGNNAYGLGLGSKLFWPVLFKREGIAFWLTFLEKFASPTPVGKYPEGSLPENQRALLAALKDMVSKGAAVVPLGSEIELLEAKRGGTASYEEWCRYWDQQMSLCVFGSTLATNIDGAGSRAASETHRDVEEQIIDADADLLGSTLRETLCQWLIDFNMPGANPPLIRRPRPKDESLHEDLRAKRVKNASDELALMRSALSGSGARFVEAAQAHIDAGLLPEVEPDVLKSLAPYFDASLREKQAQDARMQRQVAKGVAQQPDAAFAGSGGHDHGMQDVAAQLEGFAAPMLDDWVGRIRNSLDDAIRNGEDFEAFSARLLALDPDLSLDAMGNLIGGAFAVADMTGRSDVRDEIAAKTAAAKK